MKLLFISFFFFIIFLSGCSSGRKFTSEEEREVLSSKSPVRVLLNEGSSLSIKIESPVFLFNNDKKIAMIKSGNRITLADSDKSVTLSINRNQYKAGLFKLLPEGKNQLIKINGKSYRGAVLLYPGLKVINHVTAEDYLKGVLPYEMPLNNPDYYEGLKAFAISARTYLMQRITANRDFQHNPNLIFKLFDVHADVRDQVYGGAGGEREISNKAVDATEGMVLTYNGNPATVFYHSTCGGYLENNENIFAGDARPYLAGKKDGSEPYCKVSPRYAWEEIFSEEEFINRLIFYGKLNSGTYSLADLKIKTRFPASGRVKELEIIVKDSFGKNEKISLSGNEIRSIIRNSDNSGILRSILFDISFSNREVKIAGKGSGHGVGMCQWGALYQSTIGKNYKEILQHYFPGTKISKHD